MSTLYEWRRRLAKAKQKRRVPRFAEIAVVEHAVTELELELRSFRAG